MKLPIFPRQRRGDNPQKQQAVTAGNNIILIKNIVRQRKQVTNRCRKRRFADKQNNSGKLSQKFHKTGVPSVRAVVDNNSAIPVSRAIKND